LLSLLAARKKKLLLRLLPLLKPQLRRLHRLLRLLPHRLTLLLLRLPPHRLTLLLLLLPHRLLPHRLTLLPLHLLHPSNLRLQKESRPFLRSAFLFCRASQRGINPNRG
jgi:hypothetical protein